MIIYEISFVELGAVAACRGSGGSANLGLQQRYEETPSIELSL